MAKKRSQATVATKARIKHSKVDIPAFETNNSLGPVLTNALRVAPLLATPALEYEKAFRITSYF